MAEPDVAQNSHLVEEVVPENPEFATPEFGSYMQQLANDVLVWVGFGTIVGLLAKAIMPGKDPGGAVATLAMGIGGTVIGCGIVSYFYEGHRVTPISPLGFAVGTAGAFIILFFYRLLSGYIIQEGENPTVRPRFRRRRRRRKLESLQYEE